MYIIFLSSMYFCFFLIWLGIILHIEWIIIGKFYLIIAWGDPQFFSKPSKVFRVSRVERGDRGNVIHLHWVDPLYTQLSAHGDETNMTVDHMCTLKMVSHIISPTLSCISSYRWPFTGSSDHSWTKHSQKARRCRRDNTGHNFITRMSPLFANTGAPSHNPPLHLSPPRATQLTLL